MSLVQKLRCDHCGRDESIPENHIWTLEAQPDRIIVHRGIAEVADPYHCCCIDCVNRAVAHWADGRPLPRSAAHSSRAESRDHSTAEVKP